MHFTENTPESFKSYNNVISPHCQQYSGGISGFSRKKRKRSWANTSKSHFFLLFWHTVTVVLRSRTRFSEVPSIIPAKRDETLDDLDITTIKLNTEFKERYCKKRRWFRDYYYKTQYL